MSEPIRLHLGCGRDYRPGWINCDVVRDVRADQYFDLEVLPWPFPGDYADEILMEQVLEHLPNTLGTMEELHRVLKPGGIVRINVPYAKSDNAFQDPTHRRFFTEKSMDYFAADYQFNFYSRCRFKVLRSELTTLDNTWRKKLRNAIPFRKLLDLFLWNLFDGVSYELQKLPALTDTPGTQA